MHLLPGPLSVGPFLAPVKLLAARCRLLSSYRPALVRLTFLGSANWSRMSGIPETKGFYFLPYKDGYCTQQNPDPQPVTEVPRITKSPTSFLRSGGKLNHGGIWLTGDVMGDSVSAETQGSWERLLHFLSANVMERFSVWCYTLTLKSVRSLDSWLSMAINPASTVIRNTGLPCMLLLLFWKHLSWNIHVVNFVHSRIRLYFRHTADK